MKRLTAFLLVALIGWNIVLTILYLQSKEDTTAATAAQQTKQKVETASVNITSDVTELVAKSENKVVTVTARARGQALDTGSFTKVCSHYGVELSMSEISYLYDYIKEDKLHGTQEGDF